MRTLMKRMGSLALAAAVAAAGMPVYALELNIQDVTAGQNEAEVELVTDSNQISQLVADNWSDDYFGEITISTEDNTVEKDGTETTLTDELDITKGEAKEIMQSAETAEEYINGQTDYEAVSDDDGNVYVTDPYQTCRLIVYADRLDSYYGAERVLYDEDWDKYVMQFSTKEQTQAAYETLVDMLGEENCIIDQLIVEPFASADEDVNVVDPPIYDVDPPIYDDEDDGTMVDPPIYPPEDDTNTGGFFDEEEDDTPSKYYKGKSWGVAYMGMDVLKTQYESMNFDENEITVAVLDSGIQANHEIFKGRKIIGKSFCGKYIKNRYNYDTSFSPSDCTDYYGHGTACASIIADSTPTNVNIMALRVVGDAHTGGEINWGTTDSLLMSALEYVYDSNSVDVVSMSIWAYAKPKMRELIKKLYDKGIVMVISAGNHHPRESGELSHIAKLSTTISVGAIEPDGTVARFSCYGKKLDFVAAGDYVTFAYYDYDLYPDRMDMYNRDAGTSFASPHVAAAAAYVKMAYPNATVAEVKEILKSYAVDYGDEGKDEYYGYGVINIKTLFNDLNTMNKMNIELKNSKLTYTGSPRTTEVTVNNVDIELEKTPLDSSNYTVSYKNNTDIGTATVTVTGTGDYTGSVKKTFKIIPQSTDVIRLTNPSKGKLRVYWSTVNRGGGYQIRYSTKSDMSGAKKVLVKGRKTAKYTLSGLKKGRTYYTSVRAYKTVKGKKVFGRWSEVNSTTLTR